MAINKRNYFRGDYEAFSGVDIGTPVLNEWNYFSLDGIFKFEVSDISLIQGVTPVPSSAYELATDETWTGEEAKAGGSAKTLYKMWRIIDVAYAGVETKAGGNNFGTMVDNEAVWNSLDALRSELTTDPPLTYSDIIGMDTSPGADSDHDVTISPGKRRDYQNTANMALASSITKQIDVTWAVGDAAGGLFSGTVAADTTYHLFVIRKDSDGSIDAGFDTSIDCANIPTGYTAYRRIRSVTTDGSANIVPGVPDNYTLLARYTARKNNGTITLSEDLTNYESIVIYAGYYLTPASQSFTTIPTKLMVLGQTYLFWSLDLTYYADWTYTDVTTFTLQAENSSTIKAVYGVNRVDGK